jgi:two-component system, chemotaxis family, protein-glutamate methylesterase/glutaminase
VPHKDIIVVGASVGGLEALRTIAAGLPKDLPASIFVVMRTAPQSPSVLAGILDRAGEMPASHPVDKERIQHGRIYVAPPDQHQIRGCALISNAPSLTASVSAIKGRNQGR